MGGIVSAPAMMGILNGCEAKHELEWNPVFFSKDQARIVEEVAEIIIPATDTPGAKDVGVPKFIELMVKDVYPEADRARFMQGFEELNKKAQAAFGDAFLDGEPEDRTALVKNLYNEASNVEHDAENRPFILMMKELTLLGFFTSETAATTLLIYDKVPGPYQGCIPFSEVGKSYAT